MDWLLTSYFDAFNSESYLKSRSDLINDINDLLLNLPQLNEKSSLDDLEKEILRLEETSQRVSHLSSYLGCLVSADAENDAYLAEEAAFSELMSIWQKVQNSLVILVGSLTEVKFNGLLEREKLQSAEFYLRETREEAKRRMPGELEALAADLGVNGIGAWSRMYFNSVGAMKIRYIKPGGTEVEAPFSQYRALLSEPDRELRKAVFEGAKSTFATHRIAFSSALNSIAGTRLTLNKRRGVKHFLENSLRQSRLEKETLEAMMEAIKEQLPAVRDVFKERCRAMGSQAGGYYDLYAPAVEDTGEPGPSWGKACQTIDHSFSKAYPALGAFFREVVEKRWIDFRPRDNKRPGGFCTTSGLTNESRIFMTYQNNLSDMMTLAHEVGHAWHSRVLEGERYFNYNYPMTLAETASTFAEKLLSEGVLQSDQFNQQEKAAIADAERGHLLAFLLDLPVRFQFEKEFYEKRSQGVVSPKTLCEMMVSHQKNIFGDSLEEGGEDPWFWVSKLHFYIEEVEFYNYPYSFGYLLSQALYKRLKKDGDSFFQAYEDFLRMSGKASCEVAVKECLGADIQDPAFWKIL